MNDRPGLREKAVNDLEYYLYRARERLRRDKNGIDPAKYSPETPEEAEALFASHLPVLAGLARLFPVRRVLELGAGHYSTPAFLDRSAFGDLEALRSVEDDPVWVDKLSEVVRDDPRVDLVTVQKPMSEAVAGLRAGDYGLVLVDDSTGQAERIETIRNVAASASGSAALVVIHDYEWKVYQQAAAKFRRRFAFTALVPNTGVLWNKAQVEFRRLEELNALIAEHRDRIKPQDFSGWVRIMNEHRWDR